LAVRNNSNNRSSNRNLSERAYEEYESKLGKYGLQPLVNPEVSKYLLEYVEHSIALAPESQKERIWTFNKAQLQYKNKNVIHPSFKLRNKGSKEFTPITGTILCIYPRQKRDMWQKVTGHKVREKAQGKALPPPSLFKALVEFKGFNEPSSVELHNLQFIERRFMKRPR